MTVTADEAFEEAGRIWAAGCARQAALSPREAAEEAYVPGGPSVDDIEAAIRAERALPLRDAS